MVDKDMLEAMRTMMKEALEPINARLTESINGLTVWNPAKNHKTNVLPKLRLCRNTLSARQIFEEVKWIKTH